MNTQNLNKIIERYNEKLEFMNNTKNDEIFKWKAVENFQKVWNDSALSFEEKLPLALNKASLLLNDGKVAPGTGVVKMLEKDPVEVKRLFEEVLFADDEGDLKKRENNSNEFLEGINALSKKYFPDSWMYLHDRKTVMAYLTLHSPDDNFFYKYSEVNMFATVIEFGKEIGSGERFSLVNYYDFCEQIREELNKHTDLLIRHKALRDDGYYADKNNNILVFDLVRSG